MAEADLDVVIRRIAKDQYRSLTDAAKKRRDHFLALAAKAKDKAARDRHKQLAKDTMLQGVAIAKRLQMSAENAADSYARSIKKVLEQVRAEKPKKAAGKAKAS
jgi:hypothetical protein